MTHKILVIGLSAILLGAGTAADAQGRPAGTRNNAGQRPPAAQQRDMNSQRERPESRRQQSEIRRQQAERRKAEAQARRAEAEQRNRSEESRREHPPNEHAADEAFSAEGNAENQKLRDERPDVQGDNRGDRGSDHQDSLDGNGSSD